MKYTFRIKPENSQKTLLDGSFLDSPGFAFSQKKL